MIYALQKFEEDPCTMQSLAETVLTIWADLEGDLPPTAKELGCYFRTEDEWLTAVDTILASGGARAILTPDIRKKAGAFWKTMRNIMETRQESVDKKALANVRHKPEVANGVWIQRFAQSRRADIVPQEVRVVRTVEKPWRGVPHKDSPGKHKKQIELSEGEAFLLSVAMRAG